MRISISSVTAVIAMACVLSVSSGGETGHASPPSAKGHGRATHWGYDGKTGPAYWGGLSSAYAACASGRRQSPVDLTHSDKAPLRPLKIRWVAGDFSVSNNGHTIQAMAPAGGMLTVAGKNYYLLQLHFHTPSEHTYLGRPLPMEVHFVHREHGGTHLAVIGVFMDLEGGNQAFADIMNAAPHPGEPPVEIRLDPADLLPPSTSYWSYEGSLTSPPCSEIVHWIVLKEVLSVGKKSAEHFRRLFPMNARPIQSLNGRDILTAH